MKKTRELLALYLAMLTSVSVAFANTQGPQDKEKDSGKKKSLSSESEKNISYYVYIGFSEDQEKINKLFKLFLERRPEFKTFDDGRPGFYAGQAEPFPMILGDKNGWTVKVRCLNFAEAENFFLLSKGFFFSPEVQEKYSKNGGVWMFRGNRYVKAQYEPNLSKPVEREQRLPESRLGVQVGAFENIKNATFRLIEAQAKLDPRFRVEYAEGFYKIRLIGLSAEETADLLEKARAVLGQDEADFVVDGKTLHSYSFGGQRFGNSR